MINVTKKHKCSGCSACANACPKKCISMRPDIEGFVYPEVDMRKCVECNICTQVCPFINPYPISKSKQAYACKSKDETVRISSSSGGIFSLIADYFLDRGGVVFGAGFDENMKLVHQSVDTKEALKLLRGSKYVQSDMGNCFSEAKMLLDDGKLVLFSGTPCQISGLRHFLNKGYDNLFCADVVCHGVPSPSVWKSYVSYQEKKAGACMQNVNFRYKELGWKKYSMLLSYSNNTKYCVCARDDFFMKGFSKNLYLRPSCHKCMANNFRSGADITLGDYWGVNTVFPQFDDDKGTSLVLINTEEGNKLFEAIEHRIDTLRANVEHMVKHNPCIIRSVKPCKNRKRFFKAYVKGDGDLKELIDRYAKDRKIVIIRNIVIKFLVRIKHMIFGVKRHRFNNINQV